MSVAPQISAQRPATAWSGTLLALLGAACFALKAIFVKLAYRYGVDAETLLALRMGYALPFFLVMGWVHDRRSTVPLTWRDWGALCLLGFLGYYLSSYLDFLGLRYISAALERLILFVYPTLVVVLSALFLHRPLSRRAYPAMLLCYMGIALAVAHDLDLAHAGSNVPLGCFLVFGSALSYAIHLMLNGELIARLGSGRVSAWATAIACLCCMLQFFLMRPLAMLAQPLPVHGWAAAMAFFSTVIPVVLVAMAIARLGAARASVIGTFGPVLTIFFGWLVLGEPVGLMQVAGGVLVIGGVCWVARLR